MSFFILLYFKQIVTNLICKLLCSCEADRIMFCLYLIEFQILKTFATEYKVQ